MAKVICSEAIWRVADRCVQVLGGMGITDDTVVERIFRDIRAFRIYDGPSEVHRWALGASSRARCSLDRVLLRPARCRLAASRARCRRLPCGPRGSRRTSSATARSFRLLYSRYHPR